MHVGVPVEPHQKCASYDGDADRIVYYYLDKGMFVHFHRKLEPTLIFHIIGMFVNFHGKIKTTLIFLV